MGVDPARRLLVRRTRHNRRPLSLWILALLSLPAFGACDGGCGCGKSAVAELVETHGTVTRDFAANEGQWEAAETGAEFAMGDAVRTAEGESSAKVVLTGGGGLELNADTIVRFLAAAPNDPDQGRVSVEMGAARVTAGEGGLAIAGNFGEARLLSGGEMLISSADGQLSMEVLIGAARIESADGDIIDLGEGEEIVLDVELGDVIIEEIDTGPPDTGPLDAGPDGDGDAGELLLPEVAISFRGRVEIEDDEGNWSRLERGTETVPGGSRLRLRRRARVDASRDGGSVRVTGPGAVTVGPSAEVLMRVGDGRAAVSAGETDVKVEVPGGAFVTHGSDAGASSSAHVANNGNATVASRRGTVTLQGRSESYSIRDGDSGIIRGDGVLDITGRAPSSAHMAVSAGASATIHYPGGTVNVQVQFGEKCGGGEGVVEVARGGSYRRPQMRSFGNGKANISVSPGANRYRLRCASGGSPTGDAVAQGTLIVRRDSGRQQLPRRPSRNVVDTDGRRYTLLYQNILPIVTVRWREAPSASRYVLHVGDETYESSSASQTLESGQISEGTHRVFFEAPGASPSRSPVTTVNIRYDNATTAAYIRDPDPGSAVSGTVRVSGTCVAGCTVSASGQNLPLDSAHRFGGEVAVPTDLDALAIRITHPRTGIHYYLRRAGGR